MSSRVVYHGGEPYIEVTVNADTELSAQTVTISVDDGATWLDATWQGDAGTTRVARTDAPVEISEALPVRGIYSVRALVDNGSETEIVHCGGLQVR